MPYTVSETVLEEAKLYIDSDEFSERTYASARKFTTNLLLFLRPVVVLHKLYLKSLTGYCAKAPGASRAPSKHENYGFHAVQVGACSKYNYSITFLCAQTRKALWIAR